MSSAFVSRVNKHFFRLEGEKLDKCQVHFSPGTRIWNHSVWEAQSKWTSGAYLRLRASNLRQRQVRAAQESASSSTAMPSSACCATRTSGAPRMDSTGIQRAASDEGNSYGWLLAFNKSSSFSPRSTVAGDQAFCPSFSTAQALRTISLAISVPPPVLRTSVACATAPVMLWMVL